MKQFLSVIIFIHIFILMGCDDSQFNCDEASFEVLNSTLNSLVHEAGDHIMFDSNGVEIVYFKQPKRNSSEVIDENGCFLGFTESIAIQYFLNSNLVANVEIEGSSNGIHPLTLLVSSMVPENNTNNLFEVDLNDQAEVINCNSNGIECLTNHMLNGVFHQSLIKWERDPLLPESDLIEVVVVILSLQKGIVYLELENGTYYIK